MKPKYESPILDAVRNFLASVPAGFSALMKGQTPGVSPQDVYQERRRRAEMGLDPDYYTNPLEDIGLIQRTPEAKKDLKERIDAVKNMVVAPPNFDPTQTVAAQTAQTPQTKVEVNEGPSPVIDNETPQATDVVDKVDYEALAREDFRRNNPALESMPEEEEFLFNRYKRNLASKLAKQNPQIKVADVQGNPEQAFLAGQLEKYLAEKSTPESNINRRRGF
tara:strand:+ start:103 stop:765 length:663 start_codon:yes stop_codon:yes gene_type:complete